MAQRDNKVCWLGAAVRFCILRDRMTKGEEEGQPWGTQAPRLHCQGLQAPSSVTEGSCTQSEMSRLLSAQKSGEFLPLPRKIPTLAFSCKLGQKHCHPKFSFIPAIPRNPYVPVLGLGNCSPLKFPNEDALSSLPHFPAFCWKPFVNLCLATGYIPLDAVLPTALSVPLTLFLG